MSKRKHRSIPKPAKQLRMKDNHSWQAPKGYKIVVLDRGAVSFNVPEKWVVAKMEPFELNDAEPPNDEARLSVSFWRLPPGIDWTGLPQGDMLAKSMETGSDIEVVERGGINTFARADIEIVWTEHRFIDPIEKPREAYSRVAVARGFDVQALFTFDYWADDAKKLLPVWQEVMRSIQLGRLIQDPTRGPTLH